MNRRELLLTLPGVALLSRSRLPYVRPAIEPVLMPFEQEIVAQIASQEQVGFYRSEWFHRQWLHHHWCGCDDCWSVEPKEEQNESKDAQEPA
jgi:hypothetical protein